EPRRDAEVAAAAADAPEEVGVVDGGRIDHPSVRSHDLRSHEVVAREAETAEQEADPAAEGQAADSGRAERAARRGEPVLRGRVVEVAPKGAAGRARDSARGI